MEISEITEYVQNTPGNTNKVILEQLVQQYADEHGGGSAKMYEHTVAIVNDESSGNCGLLFTFPSSDATPLNANTAIETLKALYTPLNADQMLNNERANFLLCGYGEMDAWSGAITVSDLMNNHMSGVVMTNLSIGVVKNDGELSYIFHAKSYDAQDKVTYDTSDLGQIDLTFEELAESGLSVQDFVREI